MAKGPRIDELPKLSGDDASTVGLTTGRSYAEVTQFSLRAVSGSEPINFVSDGTACVIGSSAKATLVLNDKTVSKFHCEIAASDRGLQIRDLGSRNGTWVNGVGIDNGWLGPKATIEIGRTRLTFEAGTKVPLAISAKGAFGDLVGASTAMRRVFGLLEACARSSGTVLLHGETGTGKEVAAEAIHQHSSRADGPFVVVDCGSLPPHLMQSFLFGHLKGAFTGANRDRRGAFIAAHGGTIFLDEVGELPLDLQPTLLRVLESRRVTPVGSHEQQDVDVRVIAATHRDLRAMVNNKSFRSDLYYRLAVLPVNLPPLRDRLTDMPLLANKLLDDIEMPQARREELGRQEFIASLSKHTWPGNVRELQNHLKLAALEVAPDFALAGDDGPPFDMNLSRPLRPQTEELTARFERQYLVQLLDRLGGNVSAVSKASGISRTQLYRLLQKYDIRSE